MTEDDLQWKTTFDRVCSILPEKIFTTPHLDSHRTTDPKPEILSADSTGNRISRDGRNVRGITHVKKRRLNHSEMGEGDYGTQIHAADPYSCLQV